LRSTAFAARLFVVFAFLALVVAGAAGAGRLPGDLPNSSATPDNLSGQQWGQQLTGVVAAHEITGGSPLVRVALIDSGIDPGHPEFAGRIDTENSVSCIRGTPVHDTSGFLWRDNVGHGTHVAGIIAAGDNDFGTVGVAPNVQLLIVKVTDPGLPIAPAAAACAFEYVSEQHVDVANASFAVDQGTTGAADALDFFCRSDKSDRQAIQLVERAVKDAIRSGTTVVASAGNNGIDMAHPAAGEDCIRMPVQLPGIIGVAGGLILSTFPSYIPAPPTSIVADGPVGATYRYNAGTSMAAAHVSGVAALIVSRFGDLRSPQNGKLGPGFVRALINETATPKSCPPDPQCQGGEGYNGFFGHGEVNAFAALEGSE
jgi:lantibiotic leader peptide-processing serine protease